MQTTTGPGGGASGTWTYLFNVCENVDPVPLGCLDQQILGTVGLRHDGVATISPCEQLGPDINLNPTDVEVTKETGGEFGVKLKWVFLPLIGAQKSLTLRLYCNEALPEPPSVATSGNNPEISWHHEGVCITGPGGGPGGGGGGNLIPGTGNWGAWVLAFAALAFVGYVGAGVYMGNKDGKQGLEALPHVEFWRYRLPDYVADGVYFTRSHMCQWHPSLAWMAPAGPPQRRDGDTLEDDSLLVPPALGKSSKDKRRRKSSSAKKSSKKSSKGKNTRSSKPLPPTQATTSSTTVALRLAQMSNP